MNWLLDPAVVHLNHGSFGACPREILDEQARWRERMERNPMQLLARELEPLGDHARGRLGAFVGAHADDLAFVPNATFGVNAVARSLGPDDEVLVTDHAYPACVNALSASGARVVVARIPLPVSGDEEIVRAIRAAVTPRTTLALIDHVTSPTALIFPVRQIVACLDGIDVLVDGAHAPGMLELDVATLGAAYYVGNCHKWMCAPKGAGFLWVRADRQARVRPPVISHGASSPRRDRSRFRLELDWMGTGDPTAWLSLPAVIDAFDWPAQRAHNHALALEARNLLSEALGTAPLCPDSMLGSMAAVPLPDGDAPALQERLRQRNLEVPIVPWPEAPRRLVRVSAQRYNRPDHYRALAAALPRLL